MMTKRLLLTGGTSGLAVALSQPWSATALYQSAY